MFIIAVVSSLKLYQNRHPDINPQSAEVFIFLAIAVFLNVIGVVG